VLTNGSDPETLRAYCNQNCGVILGHGIGDLAGKAFRIAHMGHINAPMILGTLGVIEMALAALGVPHGKGGPQAAIDWLSAEVKA
jgi:alanine-glyoxylate transaminase / serine-glyoxylate transaminase / serine-pyruvate transaminase